MKLYLASNKLGNRQEVLKQWIKENDNKLILISNARDLKKDDEIEKQKIKEYMELMEQIGFDIKKVSLKDYFGKFEKLKEDCKEYHAFYVIGGNVFVLRQAMRLSKFDKYLEEIKNDNHYLYIGESAGSIVLSPTLYGMDIIDEPINPYNAKKVLYKGVSLIDYVIVPHYKSNYYKAYLIDEAIEHLKENKIEYKTLKDEEVIIEDIRNDEMLEKYLPNYLEKDLQNLKEGMKNNVSYLDCLIDELQGSVNSSFVDGDISEEQCNYLYEKYIRMEKKND